MKKIFGLILTTLYLILVFPTFAQQVFKSNTVVTQVGNPPQDQKPVTGDGSSLPAGTTASCPIPNGYIGCGSYCPPQSWGGFTGSCAPDSTGNGGHCNANYVAAVGICTQLRSSGNLIRTAKSIDVAADGTVAGNPVYLPSIRGQNLKWHYIGVVPAGKDFGFIRLFKSEPTSEGVYSIHFVHVNASQPEFDFNQEVASGQVGATLIPQSWVHVHVTVGLNVGDSTNDLQDYSPNWLSADRDLGMCTNK